MIHAIYLAIISLIIVVSGNEFNMMKRKLKFRVDLCNDTAVDKISYLENRIFILEEIYERN